jgi:hypothetical protein
MNLGKYFFGIDEAYLVGLDEKTSRRQIMVYNVLSIMLVILVMLAFTAGYVYGVIIFGDNLSAIIVGLFLSFISFIILLLVLFLNMTTKYRSLYEMMTNMENVFKKFYGKDLTSMTDQDAYKIVDEHKSQISLTNIEPDPDPFHWSKIFTSAVKVLLILILSVVIANGMELLLFKGSINESFYKIKNSEQLQKSIQKQKLSPSNGFDKGIEANWTLAMLEEDHTNPFNIINSYSILLAIDVMDMTMGKWKLIIDLLFSLLFLSPFIIVKKSKEFSGGEYQKEVAVNDIGISLLFFLLAQRKCQQIKKVIKEDYDYEDALKVKYRIS